MFFVVVCSGSKDSLGGFEHFFLEGFSRYFALDRRILSTVSRTWGAQRSTLFSKDSLDGLLWVEGFSREFAHGVLKKGDVCSGEPLGSKTNFGVVWGGFGEPRWLKMAPRWAKMARLGARLAHLGARLVRVGARFAHLGAKLPYLGAALAHLGATLAHLGARLAHLGVRLEQR